MTILRLPKWPVLVAILFCHGGAAQAAPVDNPSLSSQGRAVGGGTEGSIPSQYMTIPAPPPPPDPQATALAAQAALDASAAASNAAAINQIRSTVDQTGVGQEAGLKSVREVSQTGANQAATVGALYCAQGANSQAADLPDQATRDYGVCKQYFGAAGAIRGGPSGRAYREDMSTLDGSFAKETLDQFEKNFGVSGVDYMSRMLGSGGSRDELSDMAKGKLAADDVAKAFEEAPLSGEADARFVVDLGGASKSVAAVVRKPASLRESLRASLTEGETRGAVSADEPPVAGRAEEKIGGLEPLREGIFAEADQERLELTIFDVVHRKYTDLSKKRDL